MQVQCSIPGCESVTEVTNPASSVRFICRRHERREVTKFLGVRHNPNKQVDQKVHFDEHAFERVFKRGMREPEVNDVEQSGGVVEIPFDRT